MSEAGVPQRTPLASYAVPACLFAVSGFGLAVGLIGDGAWDLIATACVGLPIGIVVWRRLAGKLPTTDTSKT